MIKDVKAVYEQIRKANQRVRNAREFGKDWHVTLHYSYFFFWIHKHIEFESDPDKVNAFGYFCELCNQDIKNNFKTLEAFEQFEKLISK